MLRAGLIGFPSSGKTTLFRLMTSASDAPRGGHGKTEVQIGIARVPDPRLDRLTALFNPRKRVPATIELADSTGTERSDATTLVDVVAFRNADALVHVIRMFRDEWVPHASGSVDPARDARVMEDELILADLGIAERRLERLERDLKKGQNPELRREQEILLKCRAALEEGRPLRALDLGQDDLKRLRGFQFLSAKPLLLVLNLDEADAAKVDRASALAGLDDFLAGAATRAVGVSLKTELEIAQLDPADRAVFLDEFGLKEPALDRVIKAAYDLLGYITFFTVGDDECRGWSIPHGTAAQLAAGEIHSDIARGFIRAEVVRQDLLLARGSIAACRDHGEVRLEGKEHVVQDGDVINFRFAT